MSASDAELPFVTAIALPLMSTLDFCRFTTKWEDPKEFEAGRLAADILLNSHRDDGNVFG